ncbi:MAG: hypothetical protein VR70_17480 [Rhodospirillaceae bacterium BRH_c57]|nr:MAG: hypothetical protein VR70_17480 [Rhodospirillaceae bacterium BRH_c57]
MRRRTFLHGATAAAALAFVAPIVSTPSAVLAASFSSPAARRIGEHYLTHHPDQRNRGALIAGLGCAPGAGWRDICHAFGPARQADFRAGRTLTVDGWLVAEAEGRLCALLLCVEGGVGC